MRTSFQVGFRGDLAFISVWIVGFPARCLVSRWALRVFLIFLVCRQKAKPRTWKKYFLPSPARISFISGVTVFYCFP